MILAGNISVNRTMNEKEITRISKLLSLVLRHQPQNIGITLDESGWTNVAVLIRQINHKGVNISFELLQQVVQHNNKQRFAFNQDKTKIRANQGHSLTVDLGYKPTMPPAILYHGTSEQSLASILKSGIEKRKRHHVHLSVYPETALQVGRRHGKPIILEVDAAGMQRDGFCFYLSENKVWLTDQVPAKYLTKT